MKRRSLISTLATLCFVPAGLAYAHPHDRDAWRERRPPPQRGTPQDERRDGWHDDRRDGWRNEHDNGRHRGQRNGAYEWDRRPAQWRAYRDLPNYSRGAGPNRAFYPGGRLPREYRLRHYVVDDWRGHGLNPPPRGYHWVQTGADFVLVAIATGLILQLLLTD